MMPCRAWDHMCLNHLPSNWSLIKHEKLVKLMKWKKKLQNKRNHFICALFSKQKCTLVMLTSSKIKNLLAPIISPIHLSVSASSAHLFPINRNSKKTLLLTWLLFLAFAVALLLLSKWIYVFCDRQKRQRKLKFEWIGGHWKKNLLFSLKWRGNESFRLSTNGLEKCRGADYSLKCGSEFGDSKFPLNKDFKIFGIFILKIKWYDWRTRCFY